MNKIFAGVGTDYERLKHECLHSNAPGTYYFVDPSISSERIKNSDNNVFIEAKSMTFEQFVKSMLLNSPGVFQNCEIISDRMIEHIPLGQLVTLIFPLMRNLLDEFAELQIVLTYPDIERITKHLNNMKDYYLEHELCNIEAIAFGEHKVIFSDTIMKNHFKSYAIGFKDVTLDKKPFYRQATIEYIETRTYKLIEDPVYAVEFTPHVANNLGEELWQLSNRMLKSNERKCQRFEYISLDKLTSLGMEFPTHQIPTHAKHVLWDNQAIELITREGYFMILKDTGSDHFNLCHPYMNTFTFSK